jgi:ketosteroid isomerase-like protein
MSNVDTVQQIYAAFGTGDVPAILDQLADDVSWDADWADHFGQRAGLPMFQPRRGKRGAVEFFELVGACKVIEFEVLDLLAGENAVVAQIVIELAYPDGGRLRDEELHHWRFGADGKVTALRHYTDTAKHIAAANGTDTTTVEA